MDSQKGLTPIFIVVLIAVVGLGGYFIYQKQNTQPQPMAENLRTPTPTTQPTLTPTKQLSAKKSAPTKTPTPTPTPTVSPSPTSKPSPQPGVYKIERQPADTSQFIAVIQAGYVMSALLADGNGDYIKDLSDFDFSWSIDNPEIAEIMPPASSRDKTYCFSFEPYNLNNPCPTIRATLTNKKLGSTTVRVKVTKKSENKVVDEAEYPYIVR